MSEECYVTLAEVKKLLTEAAEDRELSPDQKLTLEHSQKLAKLSAEDAKKLQDALSELEFISEALCAKITDILPSHPDDVRVLFSKERIVLEKEDIEQILSTVQDYL